MKIQAVDDYIAKQPGWQQTILKGLRSAIHKSDPEIEEKIKWGAPSFEHAGQVAWMFCATEWVHLSFRQGALLEVPKATWVELDDTPSKAKRTMKFEKGAIVPKDLIAELVRQHVSNNLAGKKVDFNVPKAGSRQFDLPAEYETWLKEAGKLEDFLARPYYQQHGWIEWVGDAKTKETKLKRMDRVLIEIKHGQYMPDKKDRFNN